MFYSKRRQQKTGSYPALRLEVKHPEKGARAVWWCKRSGAEPRRPRTISAHSYPSLSIFSTFILTFCFFLHIYIFSSPLLLCLDDENARNILVDVVVRETMDLRLPWQRVMAC